jgi:hypothetical protein
MVSLFLWLAFARAEIKNVECIANSPDGRNVFAATGTIDLQTTEAKLQVSVNRQPSIEQPMQLVARHNRFIYEMFFLENQTTDIQSIVLRISRGQVRPLSTLYLTTTESFSADCQFQ